ncbi:MAG: sulfite exporter TauE/SafE family protein [Candidatus Velthaea sp.]
MVAPNVFVGLVQYARRGGFDKRLAATLAVFAVPFTYIGAHFAVSIPSTPLRRGFACFLLALALYFLVRAVRSRTAEVPEPRPPLPWQWASVVGASGGILSGLFSVGGAVFAVAVMAVFFGLTQAAAQGLGLALVAPGTLVGLFAYISAGDVDWQLAIPLAVGGVLFVRYGVALAHRLPERTMRILFTILLTVSAAGLFMRS